MFDRNELVYMIDKLNKYDESMTEYVFCKMNTLDERLKDFTPTEIIKMITIGFEITDDYYKIDVNNQLISLSEYDYNKLLNDDKEYIVSRYNAMLDKQD
ncbi:hypothetical protein P3U41_05685 [Mammaliicoccus sciuri]|uniref:hypothetical protein n=1 Tax=Mammaliicoccus sciuri TaxID=1296 RepID=UPI002B258827|nr:hypothetical protein [Mammaliicoccus sciuri]WQL34260.1 hypothetical protein P3U41_05685 [Mammaliicoccus sciuri]WQL61199.1 hypothetical protein P3T96_05685 [Mammaliicoccus sciuri]